MKELIGGIGSGFVLGLGQAIVYVILVFFLIFIISAVIGIFSLALSFRYYRQKRRTAFLVSGNFGAFFASLVASLVISSKIAENFSIFVVLIPVLFAAGSIFVYKKSKNLK